MKMSNIPFGTTDWNEVERTEHPGETGVAYWRTRQFDNVRVRMVEYSPATWRTTGAARAISSSAWTASCTRAGGWPPLRADARHELPGGGPGRAPPLIHAHRRAPVHRRLRRPRHAKFQLRYAVGPHRHGGAAQGFHLIQQPPDRRPQWAPFHAIRRFPVSQPLRHVGLCRADREKLAFEVRPIDLSAGEQRMVPFQSRSLTSRVPALTHGDFHLTESTAIAEYLEQLYPAPDHLARCIPRPPGRAPRASCRHGCAATWAPCARSADRNRVLGPARPAPVRRWPRGRGQADSRARQLQAWLRSDLGALRQERPTETVFWDQPGQPLSDDGHAAAAKRFMSAALIGAGQATRRRLGIADADLATALRRLWLDDLLPDTLRAYAEAQWQRPSLRKWLDHNAAAPDRNRAGTSPASPCPTMATRPRPAIHVSSALIGAGQPRCSTPGHRRRRPPRAAPRLDDLLPDTLRAYAEAQWQRPSLRKWLDHNAAARR